MDRLRRDDIERTLRMSPEERLQHALELMETGLQLKRSNLRARYPAASEAELEDMLDRWLSQPHPHA